MVIKYQPIGYIYTTCKTLNDMPIQPAGGKTLKGEIEILQEYAEGLSDLDGFSHIFLLYHFHRSHNFKLRVIPFLDDNFHGVFATRAPKRPNHIGLSLVALDKIVGNKLYISGIDILNETPLLDIKPFIPDFDYRKNVRTGWYNSNLSKVKKYRSDSRFEAQ